MALSAFGVEDGRLSKADDRKKQSAAGGAAAGAGVGTAAGAAWAAKPAQLAGRHVRRGRAATERADDLLAQHHSFITRAQRADRNDQPSVARYYRRLVEPIPQAEVKNAAHAERAFRDAGRLRRIAGGRLATGVAAGTAVGAGVQALRNRKEKS